jgi:hypothetical protein
MVVKGSLDHRKGFFPCFQHFITLTVFLETIIAYQTRETADGEAQPLLVAITKAAKSAENVLSFSFKSSKAYE